MVVKRQTYVLPYSPSSPYISHIILREISTIKFDQSDQSNSSNNCPARPSALITDPKVMGSPDLTSEPAFGAVATCRYRLLVDTGHMSPPVSTCMCCIGLHAIRCHRYARLERDA